MPAFYLPVQEARTTYRRILQESARKLNTQGSHLGSCIEKARPYYEARRLAKEVCPCFCYCYKYYKTSEEERVYVTSGHSHL